MSKPLTEEELAAIEARARVGFAPVVVQVLDHDVPALLAEVRRLRAFIEAHAFSGATCERGSCCCQAACVGCNVASAPHGPGCELVTLLGREPRR